MIQRQTSVLATTLKISQSWALRSYLDEEAVRDLAANLVEQARAARAPAVRVQESLLTMSASARRARSVRDSYWRESSPNEPDLTAAFSTSLRMLTAKTARRLVGGLYKEIGRWGDQYFPYYADEANEVLGRLPRICDGLNAAWRIKFAAVLGGLADDLASDQLIEITCQARMVALALAVTATPDLVDRILDHPLLGEKAGLGAGWVPHLEDLRWGEAAHAIAWHGPALIAYDADYTYSLEPSSTDSSKQDLRPEAWFTPQSDSDVSVPDPPRWFALKLQAGLPPATVPEAFGTSSGEAIALRRLISGILERHLAWERHCARGSEIESGQPVQAFLLVRPQQLDYMTRKRAREEQEALLLEDDGRLIESAAQLFQVEHNLDDDRAMFEPVVPVPGQDSAVLWAITLYFQEFTGTAALLTKRPDMGLGHGFGSDHDSWLFPTSEHLTARLHGAAFAGCVEGLIVMAPEGHADPAHPGTPWALYSTRSGAVSCTACPPEAIEDSHPNLRVALGSALA
jgi:hypothetical protein